MNSHSYGDSVRISLGLRRTWHAVIQTEEIHAGIKLEALEQVTEGQVTEAGKALEALQKPDRLPLTGTGLGSPVQPCRLKVKNQACFPDMRGSRRSSQRLTSPHMDPDSAGGRDVARQVR